MDIMFVNGIPFLVTTSRGLRFGTVENLNDRKVPQVSSALRKVIALYKQCGFDVGQINANPEFSPVEDDNPNLAFNLCAQNEHVAEVERYVRTVKDRVCSCYNNLPFEQIPWQVLIRLVGNAVFWLNAFPHKDGASPTMSP
jgi:hypothetical protein